MQNSKNDEKEIFEYDTLNKNSNIYIDHLLKMYNYDMKQITDKSFNIFELKKIVGQMNVLPIMGGVIIETFGLKNDKIINVNKLEPFLNSVSSQYLPTTLYMLGREKRNAPVRKGRKKHGSVRSSRPGSSPAPSRGRAAQIHPEAAPGWSSRRPDPPLPAGAPPCRTCG